MSAGSGQLNSDARKRCSMTRTLVLPVPTRRATSREGSAASYVSLNISRTWRIGSLSVGTGPSSKGGPCDDRIASLYPSTDRRSSGTLIAIIVER